MKKTISYTYNIFDLPEPFHLANVLTREPGHHLSPHKHDRYHVNLLTDGHADVNTASGILSVSAGHAFIIPPGLEHEILSENGYSQIGMDINDVNDTYGLSRKLGEICTGCAVRVSLFHNKSAELITSGMLVDLSPLSRLKCINRLTDLLIDVMETAGKEPRQDHFRTCFLQAAAKCAEKGAGLDELCSMVNFSKTHLERLTRQEFGCGVIEYTNKLRFLKICSLLAATDKKLSAIAEECGFYDSSHLCVFFKKYSGKTPSAYRREER